MNIEKYSSYEYEIFKKTINVSPNLFGFVIYLSKNPIIGECVESEEYYDTQQEARFAAIGRITLLENGDK